MLKKFKEKQKSKKYKFGSFYINSFIKLFYYVFEKQLFMFN